MATRFWVSSGTAPYLPATVRGSWAVASGYDNQLLARKPTGSAGTSTINVGSTTANRDVLLHRSISAGAVKAGTLSGTVTWVIGAKESTTSLNGKLRLHIYVTSGDSDTPRGTLLSGFVSTTSLTTLAQGMSDGAQTLTPVTVSVGDRIVVEIGYRASATGTTQNATINYGNTGTTDLTAGSATPTLNPGWIEFSGADGLWNSSLSTLADDFSSGSFGAQWTASTGVTVTGGRARVSCTTASPNLRSAAATYELQGSALAAQVPTVPAVGGGSSVACSMYVMTGPTVSTTNLEMAYNANTGNLECRSNIGGSDASPTTLAYDATAHAYWRIRESGGSIMMDTSPDNATWTTRRTISTPDQWMRTGSLMAYFEASRASGTADFAEFDNVNQSPPASGHTIAVGVASEVDAGQALGRAKARPVGIGAATEAAQTVGRVKRLALGVAAESDAGQGAGRAKTRAVGVASEVDAGQVLGRSRPLPRPGETDAGQALRAVKSRALGVAAETGTGQALGKAKTRPAGTAGESDAGQGLARAKTRTAGVASAVETAQPAGRGKARALGVATETGTAQHLAPAKARAIGTAGQTDAAVALGRARSIAPAASVDSAQPLTGSKALALGVALESGAAQPLGGGTAHAAGPAAESDTARPVGAAKRLTLGTASETATAQAAGRVKRAAVQPAAETGTALAVVGSKVVALAPAVEQGEARPIGTPGRTSIPVNPVAETDAALPIAGSKTAAVSPVAAVEAAQPLRVVKRAALGLVFEYGAAQPVRASKTLATGYATETGAAQPLTSRTGRALPLGTAVETATAYGPGLTKRRILAPALETGTAVGITTPGAGQSHGLRITGRPATPWTVDQLSAPAWQPGVAHTAWTADQPVTAWTHGTSTGGDVNSLSTEFHEVPVAWTRGDPTAYPVQMAVLPHGHEPADTDWHAAAWDTNSAGQTVAKLLVGPDGGAVDPAPGRYRDWVSVDAPPEHPVLSTPPYDIS